MPSAAGAGAPLATPSAGQADSGPPAAPPDQRFLQGLDSLGRIGVPPPRALGTDDQQSLKGISAVRNGDLPTSEP